MATGRRTIARGRGWFTAEVRPLACEGMRPAEVRLFQLELHPVCGKAELATDRAVRPEVPEIKPLCIGLAGIKTHSAQHTSKGRDFCTLLASTRSLQQPCQPVE